MLENGGNAGTDERTDGDSCANESGFAGHLLTTETIAPRPNGRTLPELECVGKLLRYEPETGKLFWLARDPSTRVNRAFNTHFAGKEAGNRNSQGYLQLLFNKRSFLVHRLAWLLYYGREPEFNIDHIDGDKTNNRIANLRDVDQSKNMRNRARNKNNSSGFANVSRMGDQWQAAFQYRGRAIWVGRFDCPKKARAAVLKAQAGLGYSRRHGA